MKIAKFSPILEKNWPFVLKMLAARQIFVFLTKIYFLVQTVPK
jgi:hypothetical protein